MLPYDSQPLLEAGSASALAHAEAYVRGSVYADGAADGEDGDFTGPERQWSALIEWARHATHEARRVSVTPREVQRASVIKPRVRRTLGHHRHVPQPQRGCVHLVINHV